jgi:tetratricopeptide (TPR) repeat protein
MGFFDIFSGPSPEKREARGDALYGAGKWGRAKLEYEAAADALKKKGEDPAALERLETKVGRAGEALAGDHLDHAALLVEGGNFAEAEDLLSLALEIATGRGLREKLERLLADVSRRRQERPDEEMPAPLYGLGDDDDPEEPEAVSEDEYFQALCNTLPEPVQAAYLSYGADFRTGYIALNQGDFQSAADRLSLALEENPGPESYVPLELATARMHLGQTGEARALLAPFVEAKPDVLPAVQLLCEVYWEEKEFHRVDDLLDRLPEESARSLAVVMLRGETLQRSGKFAEARDFYLEMMARYGWKAEMAIPLAAAFEALGEMDKARDLYKEVMGRCTTCRTPVDPAIRFKYAELSFATGNPGADILELYLALARELPDRAAACYDRVSRIYQAQGNGEEARRFRSFAAQADPDR